MCLIVLQFNISSNGAVARHDANCMHESQPTPNALHKQNAFMLHQNAASLPNAAMQNIRPRHAIQASDAAQQGTTDYVNYRAAAEQLHWLNAHHNGSPAAPVAGHLGALNPARRPEDFEGEKRNLQVYMWLNTLVNYLFVSAVFESTKMSWGSVLTESCNGSSFTTCIKTLSHLGGMVFSSFVLAGCWSQRRTPSFGLIGVYLRPNTKRR